MDENLLLALHYVEQAELQLNRVRSTKWDQQISDVLIQLTKQSIVIERIATEYLAANK